MSIFATFVLYSVQAKYEYELGVWASLSFYRSFCMSVPVGLRRSISEISNITKPHIMGNRALKKSRFIISAGRWHIYHFEPVYVVYNREGRCRMHSLSLTVDLSLIQCFSFPFAFAFACAIRFWISSLLRILTAFLENMYPRPDQIVVPATRYLDNED